MADRNWTLLDVSEGVCEESLEIGSDQLGSGFEDCLVTQRRLKGGLQDGVDVVRVRCGELEFDVLPTRGMGIWKVRLAGEELGWKSPVRGPVHPKYVPLTEPSGLGWLDGFDELLVRCGLESNGAPDFDDQGHLIYSLHGRIANRPAHQVYVTANPDTREISITGVVEETRFHFTKLRLTSTVTVACGEASIRVHDEVQNFSGSEAEMQMLYHINFGRPLLDAGSRFVAPLVKVAPRNAHAAEGISTWNRYAEPVAGYAEEVYFMQLKTDADGNTQTLLKNAAEDRGISIHLNTRQLPCFTLWKNTISDADGYTTGLEPGTNYPNVRTFEGKHGRVIKLESNGTATFDLKLAFHRDADSVQTAEQNIASLRDFSSKPEILEQPCSDWCMD